MDDAVHASCDLSALAPPIEAGEAISSWLARTADTHLLTLVELQREIGGSIAALDRGDFTLLPRVARMTGVSIETLFRMVHSQFIAEPARPGPPPPETWAVCPECLHADQEQGRAPHIRRTWTHPLYVYCPVHDTALIPHVNSPISVVSQLAIAGERAPARKYSSTPLSRFYLDDIFLIKKI